MDSKSNDLRRCLDSLRNIDGFPKARDEDILNLSDPPHYTACPNPYINDFIKEHGKPYDPKNDNYHREPFIGDISEGKNDPIYRAYSYHTQVPHRAIQKYIKHYTEPGDIVFDGFCGTGMTAVAAQEVGRKAIIMDLSPFASLISHSCNDSALKHKNLSREADRVISILRRECMDMYSTYHYEGDLKQKATIDYVVWSDCYECVYCKNEFVLWDLAVDKEDGSMLETFNCADCNAELTRRECNKAKIKFFDSAINEDIEQVKQIPVLIFYSYGGRRYQKEPDQYDLDLIKRINDTEIPYWFPAERMPKGDKTGEPYRCGITHVHHFFTKRNLWVLSKYNDTIAKIDYNKVKNFFRNALLASLPRASKRNRYIPKYGNRHVGTLSGTLYCPYFFEENNLIDALERRIKKMIKGILNSSGNVIISTQSNTKLQIESNTADYIFTDPPFGANLMYSELNFIMESWVRVFTNNKLEAIMNNAQSKNIDEYTQLMTLCFREMYRILKPNRWITVEFHNSKASVWNAIQESITRAGFIVAQVAVLDKIKGTINQLSSAGAVKNDLVINAYKPKAEFAQKFIRKSGEGMEVDFIEEQLGHLPIGPNIERSEKMLYSKMLAHYVENGFKIGYDAKRFYNLLRDNFVELDGYWFLDNQVKKYNEWKSRLNLDQIKDIQSRQSSLLIGDEKSALVWLFHYLSEPRTYSDIFTEYQKVATKTDDKIPELRDILDSNFIFEDGMYRRPMDNIEREKVNNNREKELDREFQRLLNQAKEHKRKIKNIRREALVHGFTKCYQEGNFQDIVTLADRLQDSVIEASGEIMDFVDIARIKISGGF